MAGAMAASATRRTACVAAAGTLLLLAVAPSCWGRVPLDPVGIYGTMQHARHCMRITRRLAAEHLSFSDGSIGNCLRMAFHDAGPYLNTTDYGGANGSVMREIETGAFPIHAGLEICHALMLALIPLIRASGCPETTYADVIQHTGAVAVQAAGGPAVPLLMGRPDRLNQTDTLDHFPDECFDDQDQVDFWGNTGMSNPLAATVVLSGAHSIGHIRAERKKNCSTDRLGTFTSDPYKFDNHYYVEVINYHQEPFAYPTTKLLFSDMSLGFYGRPTINQIFQYALDGAAFLQAWPAQYQEMGLLGVDPAPAGFNITDGFCDGCDEVIPLQHARPWPKPNMTAPAVLPLILPPDFDSGFIHKGNKGAAAAQGSGSSRAAPAPATTPMAAPASAAAPVLGLRQRLAAPGPVAAVPAAVVDVSAIAASTSGR